MAEVSLIIDPSEVISAPLGAIGRMRTDSAKMPCSGRGDLFAAWYAIMRATARSRVAVRVLEVGDGGFS